MIFSRLHTERNGPKTWQELAAGRHQSTERQLRSMSESDPAVTFSARQFCLIWLNHRLPLCLRFRTELPSFSSISAPSIVCAKAPSALCPQPRYPSRSVNAPGAFCPHREAGFRLSPPEALSGGVSHPRCCCDATACPTTTVKSVLNAITAPFLGSETQSELAKLLLGLSLCGAMLAKLLRERWCQRG